MLERCAENCAEQLRGGGTSAFGATRRSIADGHEWARCAALVAGKATRATSGSAPARCSPYSRSSRFAKCAIPIVAPP